MPRPPPDGASSGSADLVEAAGFLPVGTAVSTKTLPPQTTGVAEPLPGSFTFHLMLLDSLQLVGGLASGATPLAIGPRHCGQFSFAAVAARAETLVTNRIAGRTKRILA